MTAESRPRLSKTQRTITLGFHLVILVFAALLPILIFTIVMFRQNVQLQRAAVERGMRDTVRALSLAVDREIGTVRATLEALAVLPQLDSGDYREFYDICIRAAAQRKGSWIVLFDHSGQQIINTRFPFGAMLPNPFKEAKMGTGDALPFGAAWPVKKALEKGQPVVSDLFIGIASKQPTVSIDVPVIRNGAAIYSLSMSILPEDLTRLLLEQRIPAESVGVIVDRKGIIIARTLDAERFVGRPATELVAQLNNSDEAFGTRRTWEGMPVYHAFVRSNLTGWITSVGVSRLTADGALHAATRVWIFGSALLVLLGLGAAWLVGKRIASPIAKLAQSARCIGQGERVELDAPSVAEVAALQDALIVAGETARDAVAERESRIAAERFRRLAEVSAALGESIDYDKTLIRLAEVLVPDHADWCFIDLLQEGSTICRRVAVRTSRKDKEPFAREFFRDYAPDLSRPHPKRAAIETGRSDYEFDVGQDWVNTRARDERHGFLLTQMVPRSVIIVPLRVQGRVGGVISLIASRYSGRQYTMADVEFAEEVSRRAAIALDNAWLYREVQKELAERKRAEEILTQKAAELQTAEAGLKEADRRKNEFLAMLGHELRNPLGVISTVVQLLRRKELPGPQVDELKELIERQVQHAARIMDDLLDVSRISRGHIRLRKEACDLSVIVRQSVDEYRHTLQMRGLKLETRIPDRPIWVRGDATRLAQVIGNLLHNASKFTETGGRVTVRLTEDVSGQTARVAIRDTGVGMQPEILAHLFEPFSQGEQEVDRSRGGLGLGLALVKGLVTLHGGTVQAFSDGPGCGSQITVRFPLATDVDPLQALSKEPRAQASPLRILLIEDNLAAARSMEMFLTACGHTVMAAHSGRDGLEAARHFRPDAVVCDIGLPEMDGYAVARFLRQEPVLQPLYLIALTGYGQAGDQQRAKEAGFDAHLTKPANLEELERLLACVANPQPAPSIQEQADRETV